MNINLPMQKIDADVYEMGLKSVHFIGIAETTPINRVLEKCLVNLINLEQENDRLRSIITDENTAFSNILEDLKCLVDDYSHS